MEFIRTEETRNLNALMKALKKGNKAEIEKYRKLTGVKDDYETIRATVRFVEAGFVATYAEAVKLRDGEAAMEKETSQTLDAVRSWQEFLENDKRRTAERNRGADAFDLTDAERNLGKSQEDLKSAKDYRSIWND